ncbi:MAG: FUSC family protein [Acidobacteriaceae bacterium]|nr:FUSC family protein [Acidobacteriaceae bacterium]
MASIAGPNPSAALWRTVTRLDKGKVNSLWIAIRNSLAVASPLSVGIALGNPLGGVAVATGALNVSYSDGTDPYAHRARRMLAWTVLGAFAVFTGTTTSRFHWAAILIPTLWAFLAGMCLSISTRAGDLGLNTLVVLVVFAARGPTTLAGSIDAVLLVLGGGLLQTSFALLFWPVHRYDPERRAISSVYTELAKNINTASETLLSAPLQPPSAQVQDTLDALGRDHSIEGERFRLLFDQADRIHISAFLLGRYRSQLAGETTLAEAVDELFNAASDLLQAVCGSLLTDKDSGAIQQSVNRLHKALAQVSRKAPDSALAAETAAAADVLAGQLRSVARLATSSTLEGLERFAEYESAQPFQLQIKNWLSTLHANLDFGSATFRHALRLAACVAIAEAIGRMVSWQRSYWIPMTVAVILKPDFTTTFSRGLLRLAGTLGGLLFATVIYHALPTSALSQLLLVGCFTFLMRRYGPANYGIFSFAVSGLIVFLIAETGVPPGEVVVLRGINTLAGGVLALLAYGLWPTWERKRVSEVFAEVIDATRLYFHALMQYFDASTEENTRAVEEARQDWRRARSNVEASVDHVSSEPRFSADKLSCLNSMLASSHSLVEAMMEMEAELMHAPRHEAPPALKQFSNDVEFTLYYLSAALRGSAAAAGTLPKLREDHRRLVEAKASLAPDEDFVLLETDRITTTLNTLREQVMRLIE